MSKPLHILVVEDNEDDCFLLLRELRRTGYDPVHVRVETAEAMRQALAARQWDLVVSDYLLPRFSGLAALEVLKESGRDLPFIIVSGNIGEDIAVQAMKAGAHDYIIKGNLARLTPAIERELRDAETRRDSLRADEQLRESRERLFNTLENMNEGFFTLDRSWQITFVNAEASKLWGRPRAELLGRSLWDVAPEAAGSVFEEQYRKAVREQVPVRFEALSPMVGIWVEVRAHPSEGGLAVYFHDVTERKESEEQIARLNRLYAVLSRVNEAIIRIHDPGTLYREVCRITVEQGLFKMAWIGLIHPESRRVLPVASHGDDKGYLDDIVIYAADVPEGKGPTGRAAFSGIHVVCPDFENDPIVQLWREKALVHGFRSSCAFPLRAGRKVIGVLTVYADKPRSFSEEEIGLLSSLSEDISHALDSLSNEEKRLKAEESLRESAREIEDLYNNAPCGYHSVDADGLIVRINDTELQWLGRTRAEVEGKMRIGDLLTPASKERFQATFPEFKERGTITNLELDLIRMDGTVLPVLVNATAVLDDSGTYLMSRSTLYDITELREAERRDAARNDLLRLFTQTHALQDYLNAAVEHIRVWSGCRYVGVRIKNDEGLIPFAASTGYSGEFLESEGVLSLDQDHCVCTRVIEGEPAPGENSLMTAQGSFLSNSSLQYFNALPEAAQELYRGACAKCRFESIAVVPIHYRDKVLGAIHLADERQGMVAARKIEFIEHLALIVGEAIFRFGIEDDLRQNHERLAATNEELRNLQAHIEAVREGERAHIAREVHDQLGQTMTALKMDIAWLNRNYPSKSPEVRERSAEMLELVDGAIQSVKKITAELRPSVLDDFGLQAAVEWTAQEFEKRSGVTCRVLSRPASITMDRTRSTVVYRVLQESLTNVARHAGAKNVSISLNLEDDWFRMTVEDDGKGIPAEKIDDPASYGLMGMRERLRFLGGDVDISGSPGRGTIIMVSIPLSGVEGPAVADGTGSAADSAGNGKEARS